MENDLDRLEAMLLTTIRKSGQTSYGRRFPPEDVAVDLEGIVRDLRHFLAHDNLNPRAWRLLSQANECLLKYRSAFKCLEKALDIEQSREKRDLKRLARLGECAKEWDAFPLSPHQVKQLGEFLLTHGANDPSFAKTLDLTAEWLRVHTIEDVESVMDYLQQHGANTDFHVLNNIVRA